MTKMIKVSTVPTISLRLALQNQFCVCVLTHNTLQLPFFFSAPSICLQCFLTDLEKLFMHFSSTGSLGACDQ